MIEPDHEYHIVEMYGIPPEVLDWLEQTFGPTQSGKWFIRYPNIFFYNETDHMLFLVRWS